MPLPDLASLSVGGGRRWTLVWGQGALRPCWSGLRHRAWLVRASRSGQRSDESAEARSEGNDDGEDYSHRDVTDGNKKIAKAGEGEEVWV